MTYQCRCLRKFTNFQEFWDHYMTVHAVSHAIERPIQGRVGSPRPAGRHPQEYTPSYRQDMRDAGRGHLLP
jgi:hypothetical protein